MSIATLEILATGPLATVQDLGRPGLAAVGVSPSGAADPRSHALANRLVANARDAATIEVTLGGLGLVADREVLVAVTGAPVPVLVGRREEAMSGPFRVPAGARLSLGPATAGLRSYLAVRGGIGVRPVLGSRSTDTLGGLGPAPLAVGDRLPVLTPGPDLPCVDVAPVAALPEVVVLEVEPGPRADWLTPQAQGRLLDTVWRVSPDTNRVGARLDGPALDRRTMGELPPEGLVRGAVQVPPSGRPIVFLADHPVTGGYPVVAVIRATGLPDLAQARPGQVVRLRAVRPAVRLDLTVPLPPSPEVLP